MFFDPNPRRSSSSVPSQGGMDDQGNFGFEARQRAIEERKRQLAQYMAMQKQQAGPQGQMISGHYVAPSWAEQLAPVAQQLAGAYMGDKAQKDITRQQSEYEAEDRRQAIEHAMSRPTAQQDAPQDIGGNMIQGPARQPTPQDIATWAQKGAAIPSRRDVVAKIMQDQEVNAPIRAETQANRQQDREDRQEEGRVTLLANQGLAREKLEQDAALRREKMDDDRVAAAERSGDRRALIAAITERDANRAARAAGATDNKPTTEAERTSMGYLSRMQATAPTLAKMEEDAAHFPSTLDVLAGRLPGVGDLARNRMESSKQRQYRQQAEDWIRAKLRKESGASIPAPEMAQEYATYFPVPGDDADTIANKRQSRVAAEKQFMYSAGREATRAGVTGEWGKPTKPGAAKRVKFGDL